MTGDWLGPLMFVLAFVLIFTGYPVAFALGGTALIFACVGVSTGYFDWSLLHALPPRTFGVMSNQVLLAVPFFIFMGTMLERSRLADGLLTTIGLLFGSMRGGLALAVVFVGALLAAATGPFLRVYQLAGRAMSPRLPRTLADSVEHRPTLSPTFFGSIASMSPRQFQAATHERTYCSVKHAI